MLWFFSINFVTTVKGEEVWYFITGAATPGN